MWPESSSASAAKLVEKSFTIPEIWNFSLGIVLLLTRAL